jgi:hypothetical protein
LSASSSAQDGKRAPQLNYATIAAQTDYLCVLRNWRIRGIGICIKDFKVRPCLKVRNPFPVGLLETSRKDYGSAIFEINALLSALQTPARAVTDQFLKTKQGTGSHSPDPTGGNRAIHFAETRAIEYASPLHLVLAGAQFLPIARPCHTPRFLDLKYASELDACGWRTDLLDAIFYAAYTAGIPCDLQWAANKFACAGNWGAYYPRVGWAHHSSSVIASYLQALRGGRVAAEPGLGRVTFGPYAYPPKTGHFIQQLHPGPGNSCGRIGNPLVLQVELGKASPTGSFVLVHFGVFDQCIGCDACGTLTFELGF